MDRYILYAKALHTWGIAAQMDMAVEECSELIKALMKRKRNPNNPVTVDNILEEMADVEIMLEQLKVMYDYKYSNDAVSSFDNIKQMKLKRLRMLLE